MKLDPKLPPPKPAPEKKPALGRLLVIVGLALCGGLVGYFLARHAGSFLTPVSGRRWIKVVAIMSLPLLWLVVIAWHELGHVLGGKLAGGQFLLYIVGPFKWQRTPSGIRFSCNRSINLAGGLAACVPMDDRNLARRMLPMIAGGPLASAVLALGALWLGVWVAERDWALAQHLCLFTALLSAVIFIATVIPGQAGGFKTDGRRLLELARGGTRSEQEAAMFSITVGALAGVRPADYSEEKLAVACRPGGDPLNTAYAHLSAYQHWADAGDFPRAQNHLDQVIAAEAVMPPFMRELARAEYAWLLAQPDGDRFAARAWLETAGNVEFDLATRLRAEAAVLLAEGNFAEAAAKAREGLVALDTKSLAPVKSVFAAEVLEAMVRRTGSGSA